MGVNHQETVLRFGDWALGVHGGWGMGACRVWGLGRVLCSGEGERLGALLDAWGGWGCGLAGSGACCVLCGEGG